MTIQADQTIIISLFIKRMDELSSLIHSRRGEKTKEPHFGIYHHSTSAGSKKTRVVVKAMFTDAFASLPFGRGEKLRILDVVAASDS